MFARLAEQHTFVLLQPNLVSHCVAVGVFLALVLTVPERVFIPNLAHLVVGQDAVSIHVATSIFVNRFPATFVCFASRQLAFFFARFGADARPAVHA